MESLAQVTGSNKKPRSELQTIFLKGLEAKTTEKMAKDVLNGAWNSTHSSEEVSAPGTGSGIVAGADWDEKINKIIKDFKNFEDWLEARENQPQQVPSDSHTSHEETKEMLKLQVEEIEARDEIISDLEAQILKLKGENVRQANRINACSHELKISHVTIDSLKADMVQEKETHEHILRFKDVIIRGLETGVADREKEHLQELQAKERVIQQLQAEIDRQKENRQRELNKQKPLLLVGIAVRKRVLESFRRKSGDQKFDAHVINLGNEAAHHCKMTADASLYTLGALGLNLNTHGHLFRNLYGCSPTAFEKSHKFSPAWVQVMNYTTTINQLKIGLPRGIEEEQVDRVVGKLERIKESYTNHLTDHDDRSVVESCWVRFDRDQEVQFLLGQLRKYYGERTAQRFRD